MDSELWMETLSCFQGFAGFGRQGVPAQSAVLCWDLCLCWEHTCGVCLFIPSSSLPAGRFGCEGCWDLTHSHIPQDTSSHLLSSQILPPKDCGKIGQQGGKCQEKGMRGRKIPFFWDFGAQSTASAATDPRKGKVSGPGSENLLGVSRSHQKGSGLWLSVEGGSF